MKGNGRSITTSRSGPCCSVPAAVGSSSGKILEEVVSSLCGAGCLDRKIGLKGRRQQALPSREVVVDLMEALRSVVFPGYFGVSDVGEQNMRFHVGATLDEVIRVLQEQIRRGLCFSCGGETPELCADCEVKALDICHAFLRRLPEIQRVLETDARAAFDGDPAATSPDEAIFCYPGILAITSFRVAHELNLLDVPLIPRMITEHAHGITGIDIHPGATIGEGFFIDHGTGVVIGETCVIGRNVTLYQGVTLGAKSMPLDEDGKPIKGIARHPSVEDDVVIYSGATILGRVTIGRGSVIGGNIWLTRSVEPGSRVTQAQARQERFEGGGGI